MALSQNILDAVNKCVLCHDAPCAKACTGMMKPDRLMQALRFENEHYAFREYRESFACTDCEGACMKECPKQVPLREIFTAAAKSADYKLDGECREDVDLSCDICGVKLENPFLLSSSVVASSYDMCARAFEMGWAGACFKTLSLMDIHEASPRFSALKGANGVFEGFKNIEQLSDHSLEENMECFRKLKEKYPTKVIIASIMARNEDEWEYLARKVTEAGADVIELNFSCPNMEEKAVGVDIGQDPELVRRFTRAAIRGTSIPVLAKMTPNITDMRVPARAAIEAGAAGIAAINTIKSITGVNPETMAASPAIKGYSPIGGYSGRAVKPIALRYIAEMAQDPLIGSVHLSGMGGIYSWRDALEFITLGAGSLQITTAVMEYGYRIIDDLITGLKYFMGTRNIDRVTDLVGQALDSVVDTTEVERDTVLFPHFDRERCIGCGRCYLSCRDGGHQAISFDPETRAPKLHGAKCVGCHLCVLVCPTSAIGTVRKRIDRSK